MNSQQAGRVAPSSIVTEAGVDHVRLAYHYLDTGDLDGYSSLLDDQVVLDHPDVPSGRGRAEVLRIHGESLYPPGRHRIQRIVAQGDQVVAMGSMVRDRDVRAYDFVDVFTLSAEGMLRGCRRYYFTAPR